MYNHLGPDGNYLRELSLDYFAGGPATEWGAALSSHAFVIWFFGEGGRDRLLVVNLGLPLGLDGVPEPLLAPPAGAEWQLIWSSEDPRYGGGGTPNAARRGLLAPGQAAIVLVPSR